MRLSARSDIALGQEAAFHSIIDAEFWESELLERGIVACRSDDLAGVCVGAAWIVEVPVSRLTRDVSVEVTHWAAPEQVALRAVSGGFVAESRIEFSCLSSKLTRVRIAADLSAMGLGDRMLLGSLNLKKTRLSGRFSQHIQDIAREAEKRAANR